MSLLIGVIVGASLTFVVLALVGHRVSTRQHAAEARALAELEMRAIRRQAVRQMLQTVQMARPGGWSPGPDATSMADFLIIDQDPQ